MSIHRHDRLFFADPAILALCFLACSCLFVLPGCGGSSTNSGAMIYVDSVPERGAEVTIGSRHYGTTPTVVSDLPAGQVYLILTHDGYERAAKLVDVPESGEVNVTVQLERLVGRLTLESEPVGAKIYFDGVEFVGETPLGDYALPIGKYEYELRKDNFYTLRDSITIERDRVYTRLHELKPLEGAVQILSQPTDCEIYVNDQLQQESTPARLTLAPGTYTIALFQKGYLYNEKTVEIAPNEELNLQFTMVQGKMPPGMVLVPEGEFIFGTNDGAPDEGPQKTIYLDAFYIDKFEVTNKEFAEVYPSHKFEETHALMPVTGVTWRQAAEYAAKIGKRLPTELEWEKAARGAKGLLYPWGNVFEAARANIKTGPNPALTEVGSFRSGASPYGCMDMAGNAYEWTADWYQPYEGNTQIKTEYGNVYRVLRGGSYLSTPYEARSVKRHFDMHDSARADYGFRCVMDIQDRPASRQRSGAPAAATP